MKILIASDLHGLKYWTEKLINCFEKNDCDKLILLGDILYHGPRNILPKELDTMAVTDLLNKYKEKIIAVRGNCDAQVDDMVLEFDLTSDNKTISVDDKIWFLTHGHIYNNEVIPEEKNIDIMLFGHIHYPVDIYKNNIRILNPGSVSIPKNNSANSCLLYENNDFKLIDISRY